MDNDSISLSMDGDMDFIDSTTANMSSDGANTTVGPSLRSSEEEGIGVIFYVMLSIFVVVGSVGNALAIYVFASLKQKLTSTIFILTLAGTDFMTCVITIPFTMYMEHVQWHVGSDFVCKMYNFLSTTTVPFSAVVMVAIAVDRYMCICHPFHHWMTIRRARTIIGILLVFVSFYGIVICMHYGIHWPVETTANVTENIAVYSNLSLTANQTGYVSSIGGAFNATTFFQQYLVGNTNSSVNGENGTFVDLQHQMQSTTRTKGVSRTVKTNECVVRWNYINIKFIKVVRNMYFANFAISCVIVLILYSLIYRYVISQRKKKLRIKSAQCCFLWNARSIESHHESVEITQDIELSNVNGDRYKTRLMSNDEATENHNNGSTRKCSISKGRIERMRVANIKTAFTLFIVNVVFIISFLPAWLMAMKFLDMHIIIFYMHFFYNVCNPLIYAFLNQNFKAELERILRCGKV